MKSISFKNFRRFADLPEFKFGDITILVGGNNSGKSTLQKALLLVLDNIRSLRNKKSDSPITDENFWKPLFRFDANEFQELKLGSFERSLFTGADRPQMQFSLCINNFEVAIIIVPDEAGEDQPIAKISIIQVHDIKRKIIYTFDFNIQRMRAEFEKTEENGEPLFEDIQKRILELRDKLSTEEDPVAAASANQELEKNLKVLRTLTNSNIKLSRSSVVETNFIEPFRGLLNRLTNGMLPGFIEQFVCYKSNIGCKQRQMDYNEDTHKPEIKFIGVFGDTEEDRANEQVLGDKSSLILNSALALEHELRFTRVFYIQAHGISQKIVYTLDNKNDFMAQAIHNFARCAVKVGSIPDQFLRKWMKEFEIGINYQIKSFGGEGYTIQVKTENGWNDLADMGMGSNQIMVLLLSLTTIMCEEGHHGIDNGTSYVQKLIIIEEPEQNLHPRLQSKLADLFAEVTKDDSYKFLVETHSEYLIRRTQVLVAKMKLSEKELDNQNPFKVYYFPKEGIPYDMGFQKNGKFIEDFGPGFVDVADKAVEDLYDYDEE